MYKVILIILPIIIASCATKIRTEAGTIVDFVEMTAKAPVLATIKGDIYTGWALGRRDGTGTIEMKSV